MRVELLTNSNDTKLTTQMHTCEAMSISVHVAIGIATHVS